MAKIIDTSDWKAERDGLTNVLTVEREKMEKFKKLFEAQAEKYMKLKTRYDYLDRKIADVEKLVKIPTGKSGIKKTKKPADPVATANSAFASMSEKEKAEFLQTIMNG